MRAYERKFFEMFFLVTFTDEFEVFFIPCDEIERPPIAETMIPVFDEDADYAVTLYITNFPNWHPVILETLLLQQIMNDFGVEFFLDLYNRKDETK